MKYKKRYVLTTARPIFAGNELPSSETGYLKLGVKMFPLRFTEITGKGKEIPIYNLIWERIDRRTP